MLRRRRFLFAMAASSIGLSSSGCDFGTTDRQRNANTKETAYQLEAIKEPEIETIKEPESKKENPSREIKRNAAEVPVRDIKVITTLPRSSNEIKALHDAAGNYAAELLPEDQPYEITTFVPYLTKTDELEAKEKKRRLDTCTRRHALSVGLEMTNDDQKQLPTLSGGQILSYLKKHFVSIQARVYRDPITKTLYLGSRCLASTRMFHGATMTQAFSPTVAESVNNMRSLGLLVPSGTPKTPSNLRTLVLVHKNQLSQEGTRNAAGKTNYEYLFIRGRDVSGSDEGKRLELNAFATSDERTKFHWLKSAASPSAPSECSVRGAVHFTEYSHQGLYPKSAVIRRSLITSHKTFAWDDLERQSRELFGQSVLDCVPQIIDAILSDKIKESSNLHATTGAHH